MLLTGILCVDECAGLTAQCAYLIGAAPLSRRLSPSLSLARSPHSSLYFVGGAGRERSTRLRAAASPLCF